MVKNEILEKNHEIVEEFSIKFRKNLTEFQAAVCESNGQMSYNDYMIIVSKLSDEQFANIILTALMDEDDEYVEYVSGLYKQILNGEKEFSCMIDNFATDEIKNIISRERKKLFKEVKA